MRKMIERIKIALHALRGRPIIYNVNFLDEVVIDRDKTRDLIISHGTSDLSSLKNRNNKCAFRLEDKCWKGH